MKRRLYKPHMMVVVSILALVVTLFLGLAIVLDQTKRIDNPVKYATDRCNGAAAGTQAKLTPAQLQQCVSKEEKKSTLVSIAPLLAAGIILGGIGVAGLYFGREEVREYDETVRKLKGED
ncbi:MAG TPA: hypothetical protein VKV69_03650 [Actinomycetota bacterium]|nr:hypothetical protein [Actinomycetota bacterium]